MAMIGKPARCDICREPGASLTIGSKLVCARCYVEARDRDVVLWRASLRLVQGGYDKGIAREKDKL